MQYPVPAAPQLFCCSPGFLAAAGSGLEGAQALGCLALSWLAATGAARANGSFPKVPYPPGHPRHFLRSLLFLPPCTTKFRQFHLAIPPCPASSAASRLQRLNRSRIVLSSPRRRGVQFFLGRKHFGVLSVEPAVLIVPLLLPNWLDSLVSRADCLFCGQLDSLAVST